MKKLLEVLRLAEKYLEEHGVESPRLTSERLLAAVLNIERLELYLQFDRPLEENELALFRESVRRRSGGEPLQYVLGGTDFRNITLRVGPGVLIPRPETEQLVGLVLDRMDGLCAGSTSQLRVLDLCTGSGAVALALAAERENLWCVMTELTSEATAWARINLNANREKLKSPVALVRADLLGALSTRNPFDIVVSNPPYVSENEMAALPMEVREHEPHCALTAGAQGLDIVSRIVDEAAGYLRSGGLLAMEIGETQQSGIEEFLLGLAPGTYGKPEFHHDLAGKTRFVIICKS